MPDLSKIIPNYNYIVGAKDDLIQKGVPFNVNVTMDKEFNKNLLVFGGIVALGIGLGIGIGINLNKLKK